ncbi:alpha/beta hydrolase fold domain-containing protein [Mycobacterium spongiae]|uniref:Alpha/beta hydrolase fold domain-containing protein n=2 Tax=Mycobacterium spongiae TaxID=886343 RepID=A0A975K1G3_9MYCO|nr:alpha/beta hydrolase fold domain-containing protein [Mycobacterium spongiae]
MLEELWAPPPAADGVEIEKFALTTADGATLPAYWYRRAGSTQPGSAALYVHGGGMICGLSVLSRLYDWLVRGYVAASGVPMLVVDYRVAPEFPDPIPFQDCCAGLLWLAEHAEALGVDPDRLAVMGDSAGGGLAAGLCMWARDRGGPSIAAQLLVYPMLDDRPPVRDPEVAPFLTWTYDDNVTGWTALLGERVGSDDVSPYAAPARATDLAGMPPTYIDVGDLDIFRDEDLMFAHRLAVAGTPTEMHLHPGCPHAFDAMAATADVSRRAIADRVRRLRAL